MKLLPIATLLAGLLFVCKPSPCSAEEVPLAARFSERGRLLVGGDLSGYWSSRETTNWRFTIAPSLAYFVRDGWGIGGELQLSALDTGDYRYSLTSFGPVLYYDLVLGERLSILFSLGVQAGRGDIGILGSSDGFVSMGVGTPLMFHASDAVALGIGPRVTYIGFFGSHSVDDSGVDVGLQSRIAATF